MCGDLLIMLQIWIFIHERWQLSTHLCFYIVRIFCNSLMGSPYCSIVNILGSRFLFPGSGSLKIICERIGCL